MRWALDKAVQLLAVKPMMRRSVAPPCHCRSVLECGMKAARAARRARPAGRQVRALGASSLPVPVGHPSTTGEVVRVTAQTDGDKDSEHRNRYIRAAQIVLAMARRCRAS